MHRCSALFISAPASGQGKTTVSAALARYHRNQGRKVRVFKTGPDFLDPMILEQASGHPVYQLDLWMCGESECRRLLYEAAAEADLIIIATHGLTGWRKFMFGSVTEKVIRMAACPVLSIRAAAEAK